MRTIKSSDFKTATLLTLKAGKSVCVECDDFRDMDSKMAASRLRFKRSEPEFRKAGITRLKIEQAGSSNFIVTAMEE